ncbi:hypothetical protein FQN55_003536 [Onygenales sp. PD_40]|nr:hypothetical protein FQN55_003536 [Onygenales sp. PD_40]KAK2794105.1 hypothetical protein FQN52_009187 [Onygenales sp. PD_12]
MSTNRPFLANFLAAFRAQSAYKSAKPPSPGPTTNALSQSHVTASNSPSPCSSPGTRTVTTKASSSSASNVANNTNPPSSPPPQSTTAAVQAAAASVTRHLSNSETPFTFQGWWLSRNITIITSYPITRTDSIVT